MRLASLLVALLAAPVASTQPADAVPGTLRTGPEAEAFADSLFRAALENEREQYRGVETLTLRGQAGALYYRTPDGGRPECRTTLRGASFEAFGDVLCMSLTTFAETEGEEGFDDGDVSVWSQLWKDGTVTVIRISGIEDDDGMDAVEVWVADAPLRFLRLEVSGVTGGGPPLTLRIEREDFREAEGILVPHTIRLTVDDPAALFADSGVPPDILLAEVQRQALADPKSEAAGYLGIVKAAVAGAAYSEAFAVESVERNGPVPPGLFD